MIILKEILEKQRKKPARGRRIKRRVSFADEYGNADRAANFRKTKSKSKISSSSSSADEDEDSSSFSSGTDRQRLIRSVREGLRSGKRAFEGPFGTKKVCFFI